MSNKICIMKVCRETGPVFIVAISFLLPGLSFAQGPVTQDFKDAPQAIQDFAHGKIPLINQGVIDPNAPVDKLPQGVTGSTSGTTAANSNSPVDVPVEDAPDLPSFAGFGSLPNLPQPQPLLDISELPERPSPTHPLPTDRAASAARAAYYAEDADVSRARAYGTKVAELNREIQAQGANNSTALLAEKKIDTFLAYSYAADAMKDEVNLEQAMSDYALIKANPQSNSQTPSSTATAQPGHMAPGVYLEKNGGKNPLFGGWKSVVPSGTIITTYQFYVYTDETIEGVMTTVDSSKPNQWPSVQKYANRGSISENFAVGNSTQTATVTVLSGLAFDLGSSTSSGMSYTYSEPNGVPTLTTTSGVVFNKDPDNI